MRNNKFTSAADRRWQQRYTTIIRRKEDNWEYDQKRKSQRAERKLVYKRDTQLDFSKLSGKYLPAVLCRTKDKELQLLREIRRLGINTSTLPNERVWFFDEDTADDTVFVFTGEYPKWDLVIQVRLRTAKMASCTIISYDELIPPPDYGDIKCDSELSELFGG